MLRVDHIMPIALVWAASEGLPAKRHGLRSNGLEPGKESLDRLAAFQGSWARASEVGTASSPATVPLHTHTS